MVLAGLSQKLWRQLEGHDHSPIDAGNLVLANGRGLYLLASGNTAKEQDGNWRILMDSADLVIQVRVSGSWQTEARFTS